MTLSYGGVPIQPDPQLVWFDTVTQGCAITEQFVIPVGQTITVIFKSPNAADSNVWVRFCLFEVGVESIRDDLVILLSRTLAILAKVGSTTNVMPPSSGGGGVSPSTAGTGTGVYASRC